MKRCLPIPSSCRGTGGAKFGPIAGSLCALALSLSACESDDAPAGAAGAGGTSGSGTAATGGGAAAGSGGTGGVGGSSGSVASGGSGGGGTGGTAGGAAGVASWLEGAAWEPIPGGDACGLYRLVDPQVVPERADKSCGTGCRVWDVSLPGAGAARGALGGGEEVGGQLYMRLAHTGSDYWVVLIVDVADMRPVIGVQVRNARLGNTANCFPSSSSPLGPVDVAVWRDQSSGAHLFTAADLAARTVSLLGTQTPVGSLNILEFANDENRWGYRTLGGALMLSDALSDPPPLSLAVGGVGLNLRVAAGTYAWRDNATLPPGHINVWRPSSQSTARVRNAPDVHIYEFDMTSSQLVWAESEPDGSASLPPKYRGLALWRGKTTTDPNDLGPIKVADLPAPFVPRQLVTTDTHAAVIVCDDQFLCPMHVVRLSDGVTWTLPTVSDGYQWATLMAIGGDRLVAGQKLQNTKPPVIDRIVSMSFDGVAALHGEVIP